MPNGHSTESTGPITRAGFPATSIPAGTSVVTTLPAPISAFSPMVMSGSSVTLTPMRAPRRMVGPCMHLVQIGCGSLATVTPGARNTSSSIVVNCAT